MEMRIQQSTSLLVHIRFLLQMGKANVGKRQGPREISVIIANQTWTRASVIEHMVGSHHSFSK